VAGIGGLGDWFKKRLDDAQGAVHQANPFDGGRTFDTNSEEWIQALQTLELDNPRMAGTCSQEALIR
jgi:hypothetical protein